MRLNALAGNLLNALDLLEANVFTTNVLTVPCHVMSYKLGSALEVWPLVQIEASTSLNLKTTGIECCFFLGL